MKLEERRSVIAIDPTSNGVAFVCFEGGELLDWGERYVRGRRDELRVIDELLGAVAADVLVVEDPEAEGCRRRARVREFLRAVISHTRRCGVAVVAIARKDVRAAWKRRGMRTKEMMAATIAEEFRDLQPLVPPRRRAGHNEHPHANIFDAASLAIHAFGPAPYSSADDLRR